MGKIKQHFKPNFFIPGAAKSGTTSLHELLDTHPDISMSNEKEPVYWNNKLFNEFENLEISRYLNLEGLSKFSLLRTLFFVKSCEYPLVDIRKKKIITNINLIVQLNQQNQIK